MLFEAQRKAAVWLLLAALLLTAHPATARAASVIQAGGLTLAGEGLIDGVDYSYGSNTLTIKSDKPVTISGSTQHDVVVIDSPLQAYVTLDNLSIDVSAIPDKASFRVANALSASIKLKGASSLKSGANCAGLQKETTALNIVISSEDANAPGSLVASGGNGGAGIGGGSGMPATDIAVNGCTVTAYGGTGGAGIGGGRGETGAMLSLGSCTVIAEGGAEAAGIGGGSGGAGSQMDFYWNANITARGGAGGGAGIGGGMNGGSSRIDISNCNITAEGGSGGGAGIGGGGGTAPIMPGYAHVGAQITLSAGAGVYSMTFKGGAGGGAGIGGGNGGYGDIITISSGKLIAAGADGGAGIGGGSGGYGKNIIIAGGELAATGDAGGAGIGGGLGSDGAIITFANGTVVANGGGSANGGGAGVGGGAGGNASEVNISGGSLNATGGSGNGGGAGAKIGGGGTTSVNGADIDVYFKPLAIGSPVRAELYTFTLINPSKTPVTLKASSINDSLTYVAYDVKSDKDNKLYFHLPPFEGSAIVFSTEEDRLGYINTAIASDGRAFELQPVMLPGYEKPTIPSGGEASPTVYSD